MINNNYKQLNFTFIAILLTLCSIAILPNAVLANTEPAKKTTSRHKPEINKIYIFFDAEEREYNYNYFKIVDLYDGKIVINMGSVTTSSLLRAKIYVKSDKFERERLTINQELFDELDIRLVVPAN